MRSINVPHPAKKEQMNAQLGFALAAIFIWAAGQWGMRRRWTGIDIAKKIIFTLMLVLFIVVVTSDAPRSVLPLVGIFAALVVALQLLAMRSSH